MDGKNKPRKDWINILFLMLTPILGLPVLAAYTWARGFEWWMPGLAFVMYVLVGLSICAGYHRYFSHRSYDCSRWVQAFYCIFGAMGAQNSILRWSAGHRRHHAHPETDWDPYSIRRGFWWAHIIWIFYDNQRPDELNNVRDLQKNPLVRWQHRWYRTIVMVGGFGIPTAVGALFGDALAGLLWGGFLRITVVHHSTFLVNSLAHRLGRQTYDFSSTARDNWFVALLTFGEGYHSFHHRFPSDYRNGIHWSAWDPAKVFVRALQFVGLARNLKSTAPHQIERARIDAVAKLADAQLAHTEPDRLEEIRVRLQRARDAFDRAMGLWRKAAEERQQGLRRQLKETRRAYRECIQSARCEWRWILSTLEMQQRDRV